MTKIMFKVICETGLEGIKYYKTYEEAVEAARLRSALGRYKWFVKTVTLKQ